jgi:DNA-binding NtrC family response regulator
MAAVMDRAALIGPGRTLAVRAALGQAASMPGPAPARREPDDSLAVEPLDAVVRRHIELALRATRGRIEGPHGAARLLRINPHTLRARMRKLTVDWRQFRTKP